MPAG
ncbi:hypothetical protein KKC1_26130, partial [Calderihabitans maritimus]|jgi:hypothetical protein